MTEGSRSALIVGAGVSAGLGAAYARRFAREGYKVLLAGRSADKLEVAVREIVRTGGEAARHRDCTISSTERK